jgi:hypothetical protein
VSIPIAAAVTLDDPSNMLSNTLDSPTKILSFPQASSPKMLLTEIFLCAFS